MAKTNVTGVKYAAASQDVLSEIYVVPQIFTIPAVAEILHTTPVTVRELVKAGELRAMKVGEIKISSFELVRFINENAGMDLSDPHNKKPLIGNDDEDKNGKS